MLLILCVLLYLIHPTAYARNKIQFMTNINFLLCNVMAVIFICFRVLIFNQSSEGDAVPELACWTSIRLI